MSKYFQELIVSSLELDVESFELLVEMSRDACIDDGVIFNMKSFESTFHDLLNTQKIKAVSYDQKSATWKDVEFRAGERNHCWFVLNET